MHRDRWQQVKEVLHSSLDLAPEDRALHLELSCGGDAELRAEVESLLASHDRADNFIEIPALAFGLPGPIETLGPGASIGPYRIVQSIGEGGMGVVYQAVR